jgi:hypothetical protein
MNISAPAESVITPALRDIETAVCSYFGIKRASLSSRNKCRAIAWPRFIVIHLARQRTKLSTTQLGNVFHRDHTSILHAERRAKELFQTHEKFRRDVEAIESLVGLIEPYKERLRGSVARGLVDIARSAPARLIACPPPAISAAAPTQASLFAGEV